MVSGCPPRDRCETTRSDCTSEPFRRRPGCSVGTLGTAFAFLDFGRGGCTAAFRFAGGNSHAMDELDYRKFPLRQVALADWRKTRDIERELSARKRFFAGHVRRVCVAGLCNAPAGGNCGSAGQGRRAPRGRGMATDGIVLCRQGRGGTKMGLRGPRDGERVRRKRKTGERVQGRSAASTRPGGRTQGGRVRSAGAAGSMTVRDAGRRCVRWQSAGGEGRHPTGRKPQVPVSATSTMPPGKSGMAAHPALA